MDHELVVLSPEKTILTYRLAGLGSRILAHALDLAIVTAITVGLMFLIITVMQMVDPYIGLSAISFLSIAFPFLYFILLEGLWNGQTLGKKAAGIRVRMADGAGRN